VVLHSLQDAQSIQAAAVAAGDRKQIKDQEKRAFRRNDGKRRTNDAEINSKPSGGPTDEGPTFVMGVYLSSSFLAQSPWVSSEFPNLSLKGLLAKDQKGLDTCLAASRSFLRDREVRLGGSPCSVRLLLPLSALDSGSARSHVTPSDTQLHAWPSPLSSMMKAVESHQAISSVVFFEDGKSDVEIEQGQ
jgi:hypothetical protein